MKELEEIYGISIDNSELFEIALTHPSYTQEQELPYCENYERLEFLGDAVLKLITSHILYKKYPDYTEGNLSKIRSIVVSDNTLSKIAHEIGLCEHIILAKHEEKQGLANIESVCACAFEAVLGAYYLDGKQGDLIPFLEIFAENQGPLGSLSGLEQEFSNVLIEEYLPNLGLPL